MLSRQLAYLHTPALVIPLTCDTWTTQWNGLWSARAECHMLMPEDSVGRQRLLELMMTATEVPCWLPDPATPAWFSFQTFVAELSIPAADVVRVCLRPNGPVTRVPASAVQQILQAYRRGRRQQRRQARLAEKD